MILSRLVALDWKDLFGKKVADWKLGQARPWDPMGARIQWDSMIHLVEGYFLITEFQTQVVDNDPTKLCLKISGSPRSFLALHDLGCLPFPMVLHQPCVVPKPISDLSTLGFFQPGLEAGLNLHGIPSTFNIVLKDLRSGLL